MIEPTDLVAHLSRAPLSSAASLIEALGLGSQATFSRLVTRSGSQVVAIGRARARRYAAARDIRGLGWELPLFRVGADGVLARVATVRPFLPGGHFLDDAAALPRWMRGQRDSGTFDALPFFLRDALPAGFLGLGFSRRHPSLGLSDDPRGWTADDRVVALARAGEDLAGDLVLGDESARRLYELWNRASPDIASSARPLAFPRLAAEALEGVTPGPSLGGHQPKFGANVDGAHVLVKFSPAEYSANARRWCDLIVCELLAAQTLATRGFPTADAEIVEGGSRVFLQAARFDRSGSRGRRPVASLAALNAEYTELPPSTARWTLVAERLAAQRWLAPALVDEVRTLEIFGHFIANTDMHLGNLSFLPTDARTLVLAPVYDMLPMGYAPVAGDLPPRVFAAPLPEPGHESTWRAAGELAVDFWGRVARDERISAPFCSIASQNATEVERAIGRFVPSRATASG